jgi:hypothetical protein
LLLLKLIFRKRAMVWRDLFLISNIILLATSLLFGLLLLIEALEDVTETMGLYAWRVQSIYSYIYWLSMLFVFMVPQLLWVKKFRKDFRISLLIVSVILGKTLIEYLLFFWSLKSSKDYLPSSWTFYAPKPTEFIIPFLFFAVLLLSIYAIFRKRLKRSHEMTL